MSNSEIIHHIWPAFELVQDFVPVVTSCREIQLKMKALLWPQHFFWCSRVSNSEVNIRICSEVELVQDFMPILVTCKFDDNPIKNEGAIVCTTFAPLLVYGNVWPSRMSNSEGSNPVWPETELLWDFIHPHYLQVWQSSDKKKIHISPISFWLPWNLECSSNLPQNLSLHPNNDSNKILIKIGQLAS